MSKHYRNLKHLPASSSTTTMSNRERKITAIRDEFTRQRDRGVRSSFIISDLAYRYYLTESTIQAIVWKRGAYALSVSQQTTSAVAA